MNVDDKTIEPVTDLRLALGYSHQYIHRILNNDAGAGAGANAGSRLDMTFVATDPLSELVWSPRKGLSLKCADGRFSDKKPSILRGVGARNIKSGSSTDKLIIEENLLTSMATFTGTNNVSERENSNRFLTSDARVMPLHGSTHELMTDERKMDVAEHEPMHEKYAVQAEDGERNHTSGMDIVLASEGHTAKECEGDDTKIWNLTSSRKRNEESPPSLANEIKNKADSVSPVVCPPEKLESTDENDLRTLFSETACGIAMKTVASESAHEVEDNSLQDDKGLRRDKTVANEQSPTNSRIQRYQMKGKAKALSDGNVSGKMLNEDEDSHESVESCNSAGLFSTGKKRGNVEQQLVVGSKRIKRQVPDSSSFVKEDSSFMNWISNMMKGFLKVNKDEAPSLALTLANPNHELENPDRKDITCNKIQDRGCGSTGFQTIFQSLYCQKTKTQGTVDFNTNFQTEESKELEHGNKICDVNATPISCRTVTCNIYKQFLPFNKKFCEPTSHNEAVTLVQPKNICTNPAASAEINRSNSAENNDLATEKNDRASPNSSQSKCKTNSAGNIDSELPSRGKTTQNLDYKSDPLGSLWITRFSPKTSGPLLNKDSSNKSIGEALDYHTDGMRLKSSLQNLVGSDDQKVVESRDFPAKDPLHMQDRDTGTYSSFGFFKTKGHSDEKSICKLNPILPSSRFKNSEAMASIFARRLDALKHIMPSDVTDATARSNTTCFFCGLKGHHLQDCSEITDIELENLLRNMSSYIGTEELPCVCIRCFQLNHWAIHCPNVSFGLRNQVECGASSGKEQDPGITMIDAENEVNLKLPDASNGQIQAASAPLLCNENYPRMLKDLNLNLKPNEAITGRRKLHVNQFKKDIASSSRGNKVEENLTAPLCDFVNIKTSNVPSGIFDAVKRLRLSRTDILKWMNSQMPVSHLDGYFLRLRLGKWEEGLGGTGYYVACITGIQEGSSPLKSKSPIPINVGGIKCLVESQYVSNNEFLEDEIRAWWSAALKGNAKIPSEEDLMLKIKEKKMLGF